MLETIIPAGYRVSVTTWENNANNYQTKVVEGLSPKEVDFVVDLCMLHQDANNSSNCFGNIYSIGAKKKDNHYKALQELINQHQNSKLPWGNSLEDVMDFLYDIGLTGGDFYTRVFETIKVEEVPTEIHLQDVTSMFI